MANHLALKKSSTAWASNSPGLGGRLLIGAALAGAAGAFLRPSSAAAARRARRLRGAGAGGGAGAGELPASRAGELPASRGRALRLRPGAGSSAALASRRAFSAVLALDGAGAGARP